MRNLFTGILVPTVVLLLVAMMSEAEDSHSVKPPDGFVPSQAVAIDIAVTILRPIYGSAKIDSEKPFRATLTNGVWKIQGSLAPNRVGGVALVEIQQSDARILRVTHGR